MRLPQQPNFRITLPEKDLKGSEVRSALQWMWQDLIKAINQNDSAAGGASALSWDLLTNGDLINPELLFAGAEVIWVNIP